jgi:hypothetical protein
MPRGISLSLASEDSVMFKVEVIAGNSGQWAGNGMKFNTRDEAERYGSDLFSRWTAVREYRVVPVEQEKEQPCTA